MASPAFPLLACAAAAAALLAWPGRGEEGCEPCAGNARPADAAEAGEHVMLCGLKGVAPSPRPRRTAPTPVRAAARPVVDASSAPDPLEPETRSYEIPATPEGWGWRLDVPADVNAAAAAHGAMRVVLPEQVTQVLEALLAVPWRDAGFDGTRLRWLAPRSIEVTAPAFAQRVVEDVLARLVWRPAWLGLDLAGEELADMLSEGTPRERDWARDTLRRAPADLLDALRAAQERRALDGPAERHPKALAPGSLSVDVELRLLECEWDLEQATHCESGSLRLSQPQPRTGALPAPSRSTSGWLDDTQLAVLLRAREKGLDCRDAGEAVSTIRNGEAHVLDLGPAGAATLRVGISAGGAGGPWLAVQLRLRLLHGQDLAFMPVCVHVLPDGGTLLLRPADRLSPGPHARPGTYALLTLMVQDEVPPDPKAE